jgi:hypothetical protein
MSISFRIYPERVLISSIFPVYTSHAILASMTSQSTVVNLEGDRLEHLRKRIAALSSRLQAASLGGVAEVLLDVAGPLGPLGAQALWIAQPVLGLMLPSDEIDDLARVLESPAGIDWLRDALIGDSHADGHE